MGQAHGESLGGEPFAISIEAHRHRGAGAQSGEQIFIRSRPGVIATDGDRLTSNEHMAPGVHTLR